MRILLIAHRSLTDNPRGGERSVAIIRDYLAERHDVTTVYWAELSGIEHGAYDVALTWGHGAQAAPMCVEAKLPYVLMVRWWRNVVPIPPGDVMNREIPTAFKVEKQVLFNGAKAVVCNNQYAADAVKKHYGRECLVSYVPCLNPVRTGGNPNGHVALVTDNKDLGEPQMLREMARALPHRRFVVYNASHVYHESNIEARPYGEIDWENVGVLIYPNDGRNVTCGTSRVGVEAMSYGIPCLATDQGGICEMGMVNLCGSADWPRWIEIVYDMYECYSDDMTNDYRVYDTPAQLRVYEEAIA